MSRTVVMKDIPADQVDEIIQSFLDEGAVTASPAQQPNGLFTVTATFQDAVSIASVALGQGMVEHAVLTFKGSVDS